MNKYLLVPDKLLLKVGAQVMLTKNIDVSRSLVNGARGVVKSIDTGKNGMCELFFPYVYSGKL